MTAWRHHFGTTIGAGIAVVVASLIGSISRAETTKANDLSIEAGASTFRAYCANCHGETGRGDGPVARYLKVAPTNLAGMSAAEGGSFPSEKVHWAIDGREEVRLHGSRDMPIWGEAFLRAGSEPDTKVRRRIENLVAYLLSLQKPD